MRLIVILLLALVLVGCSGLAGEPEIVATVPPPATETPVALQELGYPPTTPNLTNGASIFAQNCTRCHGLDGGGQGELVRSGQIPQMDSFLDRETASNQRPTEWYKTITNGRIENLMPPWRDTLTEQERWDVAMYTYTLWYTPETLVQGEDIWQSECTDCHGELGLGDGPEAEFERKPVNLTDVEAMAVLSDEAMFNIIKDGAGDMPIFSFDYDDEQIWSATQYARTFSVANQTQIGQPIPQATEEVEQVGIVRGNIINGTAGGVIPQNQDVFLRYGNFEDDFQTLQTAATVNGQYQFDDVLLNADYVYAIFTNYRERQFISEVLSPETGNNSLELPITIYELTEDPFVLSIHEIEITLEPQISDLGSGLFITQRFRYTNASDRLFTTSQPSGLGDFVSVPVFLPPGSVIMNNQNDGRLIVIQEQYALVDTVPVLPGSDHEILALYFLPYTDGAIFEQNLVNNVNGDLRILVNAQGIAVARDGLVLSGTEEISGVDFQVYSGEVNISRDEPLRFEITGQLAVPTNTSADSSVVTSDNLLPLVIVIVVAGFLLITLVLFLTRSKQTNEQQIEQLAQQIASLEKMHDAGQINHDVYQRQKRAYQEQLEQLNQPSDEAE